MPRDGDGRFIPIELDRERRLCFDFNAFASFEGATGKSALTDDLQDAMRTAAGVRALLWAALVHEDPDLRIEDVGRMIHMGNAQVIGQRLNEALAQAMSPQESSGNAPAAAQTGRRDGRNSGR